MGPTTVNMQREKHLYKHHHRHHLTVPLVTDGKTFQKGKGHAGEGLRYLTWLFFVFHDFLFFILVTAYMVNTCPILRETKVEIKTPDSQANVLPAPRTTSSFCVVIYLVSSPEYKPWGTGPCHPRGHRLCCPSCDSK